MDEITKRIIRELQEDFPTSPLHYKDIAQGLDMPEKELLIKIKEMKKEGIIRKIASVVNHRKIGFVSNQMVVWSVPEEKY